MTAITRTDIEAAASRLADPRAGAVRATPLWPLPAATLGLSGPAFEGVEVWLKLEHLQVGGSFKARGMFNRLLARLGRQCRHRHRRSRPRPGRAL